MGMRKLIFFVALMIALSAGAAFAGAQFYNLGAGTSTGLATDGVNCAVGGHNASGVFIWSKANGVVGLGAGTSAGIAYTTYNAPAGKFVIGANVSSVAKRWDGPISGGGAFTALPLCDGTTNWAVRCTAASATDVRFGGNHIVTNHNGACRYKESALPNATISLGLPANYHDTSYVNGMSSGGAYAGQARYTGSPPEGGARNPLGGSSLLGFNTLYGAPSSSHECVARAIAAGGSRIVGWSDTAGASQRQACYWDAAFTTGDVPVAIPNIPGFYWSEAGAVSPNGRYIGGYSYYTVGDTPQTAWLFDVTTGVVSDLKTQFASYGFDMTGWELGWDPDGVSGISDDGLCITGTGKLNGVTTAWVVCIPEPSSFAILAFGLLPLLKFRRRS